jgi:hypothetical protein
MHHNSNVAQQRHPTRGAMIAGALERTENVALPLSHQHEALHA